MSRASERETITVGKEGTVVIPPFFRRRFKIHDGSVLIAESTDRGLLLRPVAKMAVSTYHLEEKASFLLSNAVDQEDYSRARKDVQKMGLNPDKIPHYAPDDGDARKSR